VTGLLFAGKAVQNLLEAGEELEKLLGFLAVGPR
jgi:hypothetical protein